MKILCTRPVQTFGTVTLPKELQKHKEVVFCKDNDGKIFVKPNNEVK